LSDIRTDRRIAKTRAALSGAMFRLIGQHDWEEIGVSRICEEANIARSTFYLHFDSPTELLDDMISKVVGQLSEQSPEPMPVLEWLVDHVTSNRPIFQRTVVNARSSHVLDRFKAGVIRALISEHGAKASSASPIHIAMLIGAAFEGIQYWAKGWNLSELPQLKADIRRLEAITLGLR
jgi:AcrR family transcriptional regulator